MANRLASATSPYLLQHAHNPVNWYEWCTEALTKAREEDKPILVSIGYSSCHWCHVMERESFENADIAQIMNEYFVCIKVDREERPDIDQIYMEAVQAMQQNGGWPLNVFLTPDQKPFYGGTYFPPSQWANLLLNIQGAFKARRKEIDESSADLTNHLQSNDVTRFAQATDASFTQEMLDKMFTTIYSRHDKIWGGLQKAPKFIMPSIWHFLLRYYSISKKDEAKDAVIHTLTCIACGGIYDQLGGGFARYSVDGEWFAPHFEKMLYDNAQLLSLYAEAYSVSQEPLFKSVAEETVSWLEREMHHLAGGYYSALDADSEGIEGKFYTWTDEEINQLLDNDAAAFKAYYNTTAEGNWEHGRNILFKKTDNTGPTPDTIRACKTKLLQHRQDRIRPGLDDKILTSWNAMTIKGLVDAYHKIGNEKWLTLALKNISFLEETVFANGKIYRAYKNKRSETEGFLEDYAFVIRAYLALYEATLNEHWLFKAKQWCNYTLEYFFDETDEFFHYTSSNAEQLIARKKEIFDNVIPASNSVMAHNLYTLGSLLDHTAWQTLAVKMTSKLKNLITEHPGDMANWACLMATLTHGTNELVISGEEAIQKKNELLKTFLPFTLIAGTTSSSELPLLKGRDAKPDKTLLYVCKNKTCQLPVEQPEEALKQLIHLP